MVQRVEQFMNTYEQIVNPGRESGHAR
jgi:hypothetical protein